MPISTVQKTLTGAALLALSSTAKSDSLPGAVGGGGLSTGGKSGLGVNHLSIDEFPGKGLTICSNDKTDITGSNLVSNNLTIAVDPFAAAQMNLIFTVSDILGNDQDHVLFLVYSTRKSPTPQMITPRSIRTLDIDLTYNEIIGVYDMPKQALMPQGPTKLGRADPSVRAKATFTFNLDTAVLPALMRNGESTVYVQAALLRKTDYVAGTFNNMILSEVDTISFVQNTCTSQGPKMSKSDDGSFTATNSTGTVSTTKSTTMTGSATTVGTGAVKVTGKTY